MTILIAQLCMVLRFQPLIIAFVCGVLPTDRRQHPVHCAADLQGDAIYVER